MLNKILKYANKPAPYTPSTCKFWNDEHISKGMLEAHLAPDTDAASRTPEFLDKSVDWIDTIMSAANYNKVLDLGCGPGLYAERLCKEGYSVTGVDLSRRSIEYAVQQAAMKNLDIIYRNMNYLDLEYADCFDLALLIYCDYAVLSVSDRQSLLRKVYTALKDGGKFIFDVFTLKQYEGKEESDTWYVKEGSGFWRPDSYLCLSSHFIYDNNDRLDQYILLDKDEKLDVVRVWDHPYSVEEVTAEVEDAGFRNIQIYADVSGEPYYKDSKTMGILAEK